MKKFSIRTLKTKIGLTFTNFNDMPRLFNISPEKENEKIDLEILFFKNDITYIAEKIRSGEIYGHINKSDGLVYCEVFCPEEKRILCYFEDGLPMDFLISRTVNKAFMVFQYLIDVFFLHSASIVMEGKAYLFIAPSGGGKSTISSLAEETGLDVISDEVCAVKKTGKNFFVSTVPCLVPPSHVYHEKILGGVYFLNKAQENRTIDISVIEAIKRALAEASYFFRRYVPEKERPKCSRYIFNCLNLMFGSIDHKLLSFKKDVNVFLCLDHLGHRCLKT